MGKLKTRSAWSARDGLPTFLATFVANIEHVERPSRNAWRRPVEDCVLVSASGGHAVKQDECNALNYPKTFMPGGAGYRPAPVNGCFVCGSVCICSGLIFLDLRQGTRHYSDCRAEGEELACRISHTPERIVRQLTRYTQWTQHTNAVDEAYGSG